ncbi:flagellar hook-length control protein FliK [Shouchella patagoniensis]|uniref:flagellar hook-length control protein FliK n=1 Tax=Shouchella patagoniensis TaxID=228576 RepID=UPI0009959F8A|nr:flagellar hook-length control protein FliK [Shouchella patagoniensis]
MLEFVTALDVKQPRSPKNIQKSANQEFADLLFLNGQEKMPFAEIVEIEEQELIKEEDEYKNSLLSLEKDKTQFDSQQILDPETQTAKEDIELKELDFQTSDDVHKLIKEGGEEVKEFLVEQDDLQEETELEEPTEQKSNEVRVSKIELMKEFTGDVLLEEADKQMDKFGLHTTKEQALQDLSHFSYIKDGLTRSGQATLAKQTDNHTAEATENLIHTRIRSEQPQASVVVEQQEQNIDKRTQRLENLSFQQRLDSEPITDQSQEVSSVEEHEQLRKPKRESLPEQQPLNSDVASKQTSEKTSHHSSVRDNQEGSKGTDATQNPDPEGDHVVHRQDFKNMTGQAIKASVTGQVGNGQESLELLTKQVHRILKAGVLKQYPEGHTQLTVKLHPETLGRMHVQLIQSVQGLLVKVRAEKKHTADLLERVLPNLRQQLQMPDAKFEVSRIEEESDERQSNKEQEEKQEQQEKQEENKLTSFSKWFFSNDAEEEELNDANRS